MLIQFEVLSPHLLNDIMKAFHWRLFRYTLLFILCLLLQSTIITHLSIREVKPDLVLLLLIYIGVSEGQVMGALFGFFAGLTQDIYTPEHIGLNSLVKSVIGFSVGYSKGGIVTESLWVQGGIIFIGTLVHDLIYFFFYSLSLVQTAGAVSFGQTVVVLFLRYGLGTALYTTFVGMILSIVFAIRLGEEGFSVNVTR